MKRLIQVNVLTEPLGTQNTVAFLAPIIANTRRLKDQGIRPRLYFNDTQDDLLDCDVLALNSKFWSTAWDGIRDKTLDWLDRARARVDRILYFDRTSTPGQIIEDVIPYVDRYYKIALYSDRTNYARAVYGSRLFAEYYHSEYGIADDPESFSQPLSEQSIGKLGVSWNTGLADYSLLGPRLSALHKAFPLADLLAPSRRYRSPRATRPLDVSCRMSTDYRYQTVAYQRLRMSELLEKYRQTSRVSKISYFREIKSSKIVVSPFGYSEINYKDFEVFLTGGILIKPDMGHLETWPAYYSPGETYAAHRWNLSDTGELIEAILDDYEAQIDIAEMGQSRYRRFSSSDEGRAEFVQRFAQMVRPG